MGYLKLEIDAFKLKDAMGSLSESFQAWFFLSSLLSLA